MLKLTKNILPIGFALLAAHSSCIGMEKMSLHRSDLFKAIKTGNYPLLEQTLASGAEPNAAEYGHSPLESVLYNANSLSIDEKIKMGEKLIESGARVSDQALEYVLRLANDYLEFAEGKKFLEYLLQKTPLNNYDENGKTPLHFVINILVFNRDDNFYMFLPELVQLLIRYGADVNARTRIDPLNVSLQHLMGREKIGKTPLYMAVEKLVNNVSEHSGRTDARLPSFDWKGDEILKRTYITSEFVPAFVEKQIESLGLANKHKSEKCIEMLVVLIAELLQKGTDPRIATDDGDTPLSLVERALRNSDDFAAELRQVRNMLLDEIHRLNERDRIVINITPPSSQPITM